MDLIKVMKVVLAFSIVSTAYALWRIDYSDLSWAMNRSGYIQFVSSVCVMIAMISTLKLHKRTKTDSK